MLKAIVSYSKKIPVPGVAMSSQGYSLSLEVEIPETDSAAIRGRLSNTFELVKSQVETELANGNGNGASKRTPATPATPADQPSASRQPRTAEKASNRQIKYVTDLWTQGGGQISELNARVRETYGVSGLYDLDRKQASNLLDQLKRETRKAA